MASKLKGMVKGMTPPWLWRRLHLLRTRAELGAHRWRVARYRPRVVRHRYSGLDLEICLADYSGEAWYDHDHPEYADVALLRRSRLRPGARVFDLGAHQGVVALVLADAVGPGGMVLAVEANAHNVAVGRRNCELNRAENVRFLHAAAAETSGTIAFNEALNGQVAREGSLGRVEVDAFSVDDLAARYGPPDVLLLDVEGYEVHVLRGARETLRGHPDCLIEVHVRSGLEAFGGSAEAVLSFFPPDRYDRFIAPGERDGVAISAEEFVPYRPDDPALGARFFLAALGRGPGPDPR